VWHLPRQTRSKLSDFFNGESDSSLAKSWNQDSTTTATVVDVDCPVSPLHPILTSSTFHLYGPFSKSLADRSGHQSFGGMGFGSGVARFSRSPYRRQGDKLLSDLGYRIQIAGR